MTLHTVEKGRRVRDAQLIGAGGTAMRGGSASSRRRDHALASSSVSPTATPHRPTSPERSRKRGHPRPPQHRSTTNAEVGHSRGMPPRRLLSGCVSTPSSVHRNRLALCAITAQVEGNRPRPATAVPHLSPQNVRHGLGISAVVAPMPPLRDHQTGSPGNHLGYTGGLASRVDRHSLRRGLRASGDYCFAASEGTERSLRGFIHA